MDPSTAAKGRRWWVFVFLVTGLLFLTGHAIYPSLRSTAQELYQLANTLNAAMSGPLNRLRLSTHVPLLAPLLLGLLAATAPCQLSTGLATLAFVARDGKSNRAWSRSLAFVLARVLVYGLLGAVAVFLLGGRLEAPGALLTGIRRVLGPLMFVIGLVVLGVLRPRFSLGTRLAAWTQARAHLGSGTPAAFLLGLAFSLAFCPTLFFLFFGLTLPLSLTAPLGPLYPVAFALGVMLPLLVVVALLPGPGSPGSGSQGRQLYAGGLRRAHRMAAPLAGSVFVLAGLYDTFVYWLL